MFNINITVLYEYIELKGYKLSDFVPEFFRIPSIWWFFSIWQWHIEINLIRLEKGSTFILKIELSLHTVKNRTYKRKLIFLRIGEQICTIQKYKCKKCGKVFYSDLYLLFIQILILHFQLLIVLEIMVKDS